MLDEARAALSGFLESRSPTRDQLAELAAHAIRLAYLDEPYRSSRLDPHFEHVESEEVEDLMAMLDIVPFESLLPNEILLLNPSFGESSQLMSGADTDLIAGDLLVDIKATAKGEMSVRDLDQLLGYYLLARNQRRLDPKFPEINRVALYFCRHGHLWSMGVTNGTDRPDFAGIEEWFFTRAREEQRRRSEALEKLKERVGSGFSSRPPSSDPEKS
jgi:hypothetical protein